MNGFSLALSSKLIGTVAAIVMISPANPQVPSQSPTPAMVEKTQAQNNATLADPRTAAEMKADSLMSEGKYEAAIKEFASAPQNSAAVCNKTGMAYHHLLNMSAAKAQYERALKLDPKYADAMNNLGTIFYAAKNYHSAEKLYKKAIKLSPKNPTIYGNLGTMYFVVGDNRKGSDAYRTAFALDPHIFERAKANGVGEAVAPHERAMMNYSLAKTYAEVGMNERALQYLRMAIGEGFKDRKKLMADKEFAALRETPEFGQLLQEQGLQ
jgi:tetratricopeptide (TPR) repeat protein